MIRRRSTFLIAILLSFAASSATAQDRSQFFLEPHGQALWLLNEPAYLVGLRIGKVRADGFSLYFGVSALAKSTSSSAPGPGAGNAVRWLGRLSSSIRHSVAPSERFTLDAGAVFAVGLGDAYHCGGTDACVGGALYFEAGPEVGATVNVASRLGVRFSAGYALNAFILGPSGGSRSLGIGLRFLP